VNETLEAASAASAASAMASKATYGGSLAVLGGWAVSSEAAVLVGMLIGVLGFAVQWFYRHREYKLRLKEHALRMARPHVTTDTEV
jgi:hypothetical protein